MCEGKSFHIHAPETGKTVERKSDGSLNKQTIGGRGPKSVNTGCQRCM